MRRFPTAPTLLHSPLTSALGDEAHQALDRLEELELLVLEQAGVGTGSQQRPFHLLDGAALPAQQPLQLLLLQVGPRQLRLLLHLHLQHPPLQDAGSGMQR